MSSSPPAASSFIRPITQRLPDSKTLWDETNLPLAVVLTPHKLVTSATATTQESTTTASRMKKKPITAIPKCLHCGAPHPTKASHYRPLHHTTMICYLCGNSCSTELVDQQEARVDEQLDVQVYDRVITETPTTVFQLPLFSEKNSPKHDGNDKPTLTWDLPAMACPVIWWIVLDASCTNGAYWSSVGSTIAKALEGIPSYVHIGMVAARQSSLSSWDLTSPIPHVLHSSQEGSLSAGVDSLCLVPCDALHVSNIQAALRAVTDYEFGVGGGGIVGSSLAGMALGFTIETILEFMAQASHPASVPEDHHGRHSNSNDASVALKYAGGKILCLLGGPPVEIQSHQRHSPQPFYNGGIGGSCAPPVDKWQGCDRDPLPDVEPTDMTPSNLSNYTSPLQVENLHGTKETLLLGDDYYQKLGAKCAEAALGVDVIVVSPQDSTTNTSWFGLPFLRGLSDRSGAPGPIIVGADYAQLETLQQQVLARTPWQPGMIFGGELRLRISPGFQVDASPVEPVQDKENGGKGNLSLQLAPFATSGGIMGPATAISDDSQLWIFGSCDPYTSVTVDIEVVDKDIRETYHVAEYGDVALKHVIQTCFAYTTVESDDEGRAYIVRYIRVSSLKLPMVSEVEAIYDALDPEALAVVLFHKLALSTAQDGLVETQKIGNNWLKSLLVCVYLSAQAEQERRKGGLIDEEGLDVTIPGCSPNFVSNERLLDQKGGQLDTQGILLGQGHEQIQIIPFLVYALLQCEAFRPTNGAFRPSMDARCAAMAQMSSMTPSVLAKCVAPCLQLWSTEEDMPVMEMLDLNNEVVQYSLQECKEGDVLFLDCPQDIRLWTARSIMDPGSGELAGDKTNIKVGPNLQAAIDCASAAYRTPSTLQYQANGSDCKDAKRALDDVLIEDKPTATRCANYAAWKEDIATLVQE